MGAPAEEAPFRTEAEYERGLAEILVLPQPKTLDEAFENGAKLKKYEERLAPKDSYRIAIHVVQEPSPATPPDLDVTLFDSGGKPVTDEHEPRRLLELRLPELVFRESSAGPQDHFWQVWLP